MSRDARRDPESQPQDVGQFIICVHEPLTEKQIVALRKAWGDAYRGVGTPKENDIRWFARLASLITRSAVSIYRTVRTIRCIKLVEERRR